MDHKAGVKKMLSPSSFQFLAAGSTSGQMERVIACGLHIRLQYVQVDGTARGVAVLVARLDLAANSQTCLVSGLRLGQMSLKCTLQPFLRMFFEPSMPVLVFGAFGLWHSC